MIIKFFKNNWDKILTVLTPTILLIIYFCRDVLFEKYKQKLDVITEYKKSEYQKSLSNHNLYIEKRNLVYCEVYEKLRNLHMILLGNSSEEKVIPLLGEAS